MYFLAAKLIIGRLRCLHIRELRSLMSRRGRSRPRPLQLGHSIISSHTSNMERTIHCPFRSSTPKFPKFKFRRPPGCTVYRWLDTENRHPNNVKILNRMLEARIPNSNTGFGSTKLLLAHSPGDEYALGNSIDVYLKGRR